MDAGDGSDEKSQAKGKGEDFENDLETNTSAFEALERDFQDVSNEIFSISCSATSYT